MAHMGHRVPIELTGPSVGHSMKAEDCPDTLQGVLELLEAFWSALEFFGAHLD